MEQGQGAEDDAVGTGGHVHRAARAQRGQEQEEENLIWVSHRTSAGTSRCSSIGGGVRTGLGRLRRGRIAGRHAGVFRPDRDAVPQCVHFGYCVAVPKWNVFVNGGIPLWS